jgi:hypothetical protein
MSNFNLVFAYDQRAADWLEGRGHPHAAVRPGNCVPTTADMKWALDSIEDFVFDSPSGEEELSVDEGNGCWMGIDGFDWDAPNTIPGDCFYIQGGPGMFQLLIKLCERCGQLYFVPDTGAPAIVLDASLDAATVYDLWIEVCQDHPYDAWTIFFEEMYGD